MCARSLLVRRPGSGVRMARERQGGLPGFDAPEMSPGSQIAAATAVLAPVMLSGIFLVAFFPGMWWIFTTYFWIAFPAVGLLARGLAGLGKVRKAHPVAGVRERALLVALRDHGELSPALLAVETALTVGEADRILKRLAQEGHLEVRVRGGGIFYALWNAERGPGEEPACQIEGAG